MNSWNASAEHCQPCDNFTPTETMYGRNEHECFAPFDRDIGHPCGGVVSFCENCHSDHHKGGYETCTGARGGCRRNHPACLAAQVSSDARPVTP